MKRTLQHRKGVFALLLALSLGMGTAYASYDFSAVCSTGQTLYYNIIDATNHYVEITLPNDDGSPWHGYDKPSGNITLPSTVTYGDVTYTVKRIGNQAFHGCNGLTGSLTIPNSVTTIGYYAFWHCSNLTGSLTLSSSLTSIGECAFELCSFTGSLTIPNSVTTIGDYAFNWCDLFDGTLTIGNSVVTIGEGAFVAWRGITQVNYNAVNCADVIFDDDDYDASPFEDCRGILTIGSNVQRIPAHLFKDADFTQVNFNATNCADLSYGIDNSPFAGCVGTLTIGTTVQRIPQNMFFGCSGLTGSLTIPNSVTSIGPTAFFGCNGFTGSLTIGNAVTSIGQFAFYNCSGFTGSLTIPNSVTSIAQYAFYNCSGFTSILALPETPPTMGTSPFYGMSTSIPVYVPCASLENYQSASGWSSFTNMQCHETLTVHDGTVTNGYVPVYGYYTDAYLKAEFVIPADELAGMTDNIIRSMKFYAIQDNVSWGNANFQVFLTEVADATISAFAGPGTVVYQGALSIVGGEMTVNFTTPYLYNGGNLLVGIYNTVKGSYVTSTWYGETVNNASVQGYDYNSLESVQPTQRNFIPKTSFTYTPSECARPNGLTATDITTTSAMLSWNGYQDSYDVRYRKKPLFFEDFENGLPSDWTTIDNDGDGYDWHSVNYSSSFCHSGSTIMVSASYDNDNSTVLTPDNWLITPLLDLQGTMKVWIRALHPSYAQEHFAIYLSTTGTNVSDFTTVLVPETTLNNADYHTYAADLSAYEGQQGYIAIRHFNCSDMYEILLDDFGLYDDPSETGDWTMVEDIQGSALILGSIDFDSEFEWQVRGRDCDGEGSYTDWSAVNVFTTEALCAPEDKCLLTFTLTDSYGDGWNGAALDVYDAATNILLASLSAPNHGLISTPTTDTYTLAVCDGREIMFWWENGSYDSECSYTVTDVNGNEVFSGTGAMSEPFNYIVDCPQQYIFLTDGNWNNGSCWNTGTVPPAGSDVIIQANVTVPAGYLAVANAVSLDGGSITVADGGQLKHNTLDLMVTMKKNIAGYDDANSQNNYYLLAVPFLSVQVPTAMTANPGSDFYRFDPSETGAEWRNHKEEPITFVQRRYGYLYANPESVELSLTGITLSVSNEFTMNYTVDYTEGSSNPSNGWALLGNPFTYNAYVYRFDSNNEFVPMPIMMYDEEGELQTIYGGPVAPMQGFFVHVTETTTVYFSGTAHLNDYVDLGLPSGLLWATCNVGANVPEEYGDYFAWGETTPKDTYNWSTYQYCNGSFNTLTKYCNNSSYGYEGFTDDLTTLLPEDDAATANWGSGWRMPTEEEWEELLDNTTVTWTTQNGVNGRLFTATNGNSLFLPAAGARWDGELGNVGSGNYWSSSLDMVYSDNSDNALGFGFESGGYIVGYAGRYYGFTVRPVRSAQN